MKRTLLVGFVLTVLGFADYATAQQAQERAEAPVYSGSDKPGNAWLNGTWSGTAPSGGRMEIQLSVINDNEVSGTARNQQISGNPNASVTGTVSPEGAVDLYFIWSINGARVHYRLSRDADGNLQGQIGRLNPASGRREMFDLYFTKDQS